MLGACAENDTKVDLTPEVSVLYCYGDKWYGGTASEETKEIKWW